MAAHVDHGLRPGSAHDADCARALADALSLPFDARRLEIAPGAGIPERAREARYEALAEIARGFGAEAVLVAHHADDQLETMLLAVARGAGLSGLGGMPARRMLGDQGGTIALVRPCLRIRRESLRAACVELGICWCEDPGNERRETPRGVVRHVVVPALESIAAGCAGRAARTAELARLGAVLLESHVESMRSADGSIARAALRGGPEALAATAAWLLCGDDLADPMRWAAAEAATDDCTDPRRFPLAGGGALVVDAHAMRVERPQGSDPLAGRQRS